MSKVNEFTELGRKIFHYRMAGDDMYDIAERLGLNVALATKAYKAYATTVARDGDPEDRRAAVELEVSRLDTLMAAYWLDATQGGDKQAAKIVLDTIAQRAKFMQLDKVDTSDPTVLQQVLVIGQSQADFIQALESGRALGGAPADNVIRGTVEEEITL